MIKVLSEITDKLVLLTITLVTLSLVTLALDLLNVRVIFFPEVQKKLQTNACFCAC